MNELQKKTAQAIVNIFETGRVLGDYGNVTVLKGDTGHLTYGRSQTTLASGNLALLLHAYCEAGGGLADRIEPHLGAFDRRDLRLDGNEKVKALLREAGQDPVMRRVQDAFFDRVYWAPSLNAAGGAGISRPLGVAVVYDSHIHGSYARMLDRTNAERGGIDQLGEEGWVAAYVETRSKWLANHANALLRKTVYRMESFEELISEKRWDLSLPLNIRNVMITEAALAGETAPPVVMSAAEPGERVLFYRRPLMRGADVEAVQRALGLHDDAIDGIFGQATDAAVRAFQEKERLKIDGKVGPATRAALGL